MRTPRRPHGPAGFEAFDAISTRTQLFTAADGRAFAQIPTGVPSRLSLHDASGDAHRSLPIRSRAFREWFFAQAYADLGTIPTSHAWTALCRHLEAQASREPSRCQIRVARRVESRGHGALPDKVLIDLANPEGQYVEITPAGYSLAAGKGVNFETSTSTFSLPIPAPVADASDPLTTLRHALNLSSSQPDFLRCLAWLLTALRPDGPYPILILRGPTNSGKSIAARLLRALVDPCAAPLGVIPSSTRDLATLAQNNWLLAFDHVAALKPHIAHELCRLSSGVGLPQRQTGEPEPVQLWLKRPILLTVTEDFEPHPDLAARAITVHLPPLTAATNRTEAELNATFLDAYPAIFGLLCHAISTILASPFPVERHSSRLADTLAWAVAAAPALGCTADEMHQALHHLPNTPPIVETMVHLLKDTPDWTGTATDLDPSRPPQSLSHDLRKHDLDLNDAGIALDFQRTKSARQIHLTSSPKPNPTPQPTPDQPLTEDKIIEDVPPFLPFLRVSAPPRLETPSAYRAPTTPTSTSCSNKI